MKQLWLIACLGLTACGSGSSNDSNDSYTDDGEILQQIYAYDRSAPYSENLVECVRAYQNEESCYLDVLPPLSRTYSAITVDQIMERVVVSHDWMAERFREVLELAPEPALELFSPLTAVVISYDIIPAFYAASTGAIYLDPRYLWTTPEEYNTILEKEDYRADYDEPLALTTYYWYEDSTGELLSLDNTPAQPKARSLSSVTRNIMRLFFHELAHANDFLPPEQRTQIHLPAGNQTYYDVVYDNYYVDQASIQQQLVQLSNTTLLALADVLYQGETPSLELITLSAYSAGELFESEGASDHYAYSTASEDVAMLAEEALMSYSYDAVRSMLFLDKSESSVCNYPVGWGQQGRIGAPLVMPRAQQVISQMIPFQAFEINAHLQSLPTPYDYPTGETLCTLLPAQVSSYSALGESQLVLPKLEPHSKPMTLPF